VQIPYTSSVDARSLRTDSQINVSGINPDTFGAGIGRAKSDLGNTLQGASNEVFSVAIAENERKRKEQTINSVVGFDFSKEEQDLKANTDKYATNYTTEHLNAYKNKVEEYTGNIQDDRIRTSVKTNLLSRLPSIAEEQRAFEYRTREKGVLDDTNNSLNTIQNRVYTNPSSYDENLNTGYALIDSSSLQASLKSGARTAYKENTAESALRGKIDKASGLLDIENVISELSGRGVKDWTSEVSPAKFASLSEKAEAKRKEVYSLLSADAKARLDVIEESVNSGNPVTPQSQQSAATAVRNSGNPKLINNLGLLTKKSELNDTYRKEPPALILNAASVYRNKATINTNLPVDITNHIQEASTRSGLNAVFMQVLINKESGAQIRAANNTNKYNPNIAGADALDTTTLSQITNAGARSGLPLTVVKPQKNAFVGDNGEFPVSVSTKNMLPDQKAKVAAALIDEGFTSIAESKDYITVGRARTVSSAYSDMPDGSAWSGYSNISPEVAAVLQQKGYKAGLDSSGIKRESTPKSEVNYDIPNTGGTSTARGVGQFIDRTWLETVKDPAFAKDNNIPQGMTDQQLLDLRKDPALSINATAFYASRNKKIIENSIGRPVDDAELYLGHLLGAGGAIAFIKTQQNEPATIAANLMPEAAKANKPLFYMDAGKPTEKPLTVGELYTKIASDFTLAPSSFNLEFAKHLDKIAARNSSALEKDPIKFVAENGVMPVRPLEDADSFALRGLDAVKMADMYKLTNDKLKVFTEEESNNLTRTIQTGTPDDVLDLMSKINSMGGVSSKAALKQLGKTEPEFAYAGGLYSQGDITIAKDILRGRKKLADNPNILKDRLVKDSDLEYAFTKVTGFALEENQPLRNVIKSAASALYINQSQYTNGLDTKVYENSIKQVLGNYHIKQFNGVSVYLPKDIEPDTLSSAIKRMDATDWSDLSVDATVPSYASGAAVASKDLVYDANLIYLGGDLYTIRLSDKTYVTNGAGGNFKFKLDANKIKYAANRK
jgi:hypothetical protein